MEVWWCQKIRVRDYCRFWLYYPENMKKSFFEKCLCVCLCVYLSVCLSVYRFFSMANDNSRKFKQNQIMFRIQSWIVEFSRPVSYTHLDVYKRQVQKVPRPLSCHVRLVYVFCSYWPLIISNKSTSVTKIQFL